MKKSAPPTRKLLKSVIFEVTLPFLIVPPVNLRFLKSGGVKFKNLNHPNIILSQSIDFAH